MKTIKSIIAGVLALSLCGCGSSSASSSSAADGIETSSPIQITGVYYGNIRDGKYSSYWDSTEGMSDCIITFDFVNDETNRTMPELSGYANNSDITLEIGANSYTAYTSDMIEYITALDRYTDMKMVAGYGNVLGGADPIKMYCVFFVNPNDLKNDNTITLTFDDLSGSVSAGKAKEIHHISDILEDGSQEKLAADLLVRVDTEFENFTNLSDNLIGIPSDSGWYRDSGSEWSLIHDCMVNTLSDSIGATLDAMTSSGGDSNLGYDATVFSADVTGTGLEAEKDAFPDIAGSIDGMANISNTIAEAAVATGSRRETFENGASEFAEYYADIVSFFSVDVLTS